MVEITPVNKTVFHKTNGATVMYSIDAHNAVALHPDEWSFLPWDDAPSPNQPNGEPLVVVPNAWEEMATRDRIRLARDLGAVGNISGSAADEFIQDYVNKNVSALEVPAESRVDHEKQELERAAEVDRVRAEAAAKKDKPAEPAPSSTASLPAPSPLKD